jgi:hypothetical protein
MAELSQMVKAIRSALATIATIASASAAQACTVPGTFALEGIRYADAIFAGRLIDYQQIKPRKTPRDGPYAVLTIEVDAVIKGRVPRTVQVSWRSSHTALPDDWTTDVPLLIGASRYRENPPEPALKLLHGPCVPPFMLDDTKENRANIQKVLRGEPVPPHDYFSLQQAEMERFLAATEVSIDEAGNSTDHSHREWIMLGGFASILISICLAAWLVSMRRS